MQVAAECRSVQDFDDDSAVATTIMSFSAIQDITEIKTQFALNFAEKMEFLQCIPSYSNSDNSCMQV